MKPGMKFAFLAGWALWVFGGCTCEERTTKRSAKIELPSADGTEWKLVDFVLDYVRVRCPPDG